MKKLLTPMIICSMLLVGCNTKTQNTNNSINQDYNKLNQTADEITNRDFLYRLVTEKSEYLGEETVNLYAELEYIGGMDDITIYHAASPFYFDMKEKLRDYTIHYAMDEPLISTTLSKGTPLRQEYILSGGYSDQDNPEYIAFMQDFLANGFPAGHYIVDGYVSFYVEEEGEKEDYHFGGSVNFEVKE